MQEAHYPIRNRNISLHTLSIEQHTSANHNELLSRHSWGFVLKCERVRVCLKRESSIKLREERKYTFDQDFIRDHLQAFLQHHPLFLFLRRTAANYTTAILNAESGSNNQNKAKACSTCVTLNHWGLITCPPKHTSPCSTSQGASPTSPLCSSVPEQLQSSIRTRMGLETIPPHWSIPTNSSTTQRASRTPYTVGLEPHNPQLPHRPVSASNLGNPCTLTTLQQKNTNEAPPQSHTVNNLSLLKIGKCMHTIRSEKQATISKLLPTQQDDTSFLPSFFPFQFHSGDQKVTQECLHAHKLRSTHRI